MNQMSFDFRDKVDAGASVCPASTLPAGQAAVTSRVLPKRTRRDALIAIVPPILASRDAFISPVSLTLADVSAKAAADWTINDIQRRDIVSSLSRIETMFATPLDKLDASPRRLRALFASRTAAQIGVSDKSFANIRSLSIQALARYALPDLPVTRRFAMAPAWRQLLNRIEKPYNRQPLHRFAIYCSRIGLSADDVTPDTLQGRARGRGGREGSQ